MSRQIMIHRFAAGGGVVHSAWWVYLWTLQECGDKIFSPSCHPCVWQTGCCQDWWTTNCHEGSHPSIMATKGQHWLIYLCQCVRKRKDWKQFERLSALGSNGCIKQTHCTLVWTGGCQYKLMRKRTLRSRCYLKINKVNSNILKIRMHNGSKTKVDWLNRPPAVACGVQQLANNCVGPCNEHATHTIFCHPPLS